MQIRIPTSLRATLLVVACVAFGANTSAATFTFPAASAPCNTTLQACIDAAAGGDIVELATNSEVAEFVTIDKSLTLRPAVGFTPSLQSAFALASISNVTVTITRLTITSSISGRLGAGGGNLVFNATDNIISASQRSAIGVSDGTNPGTYGNKTVTITGNRIAQSVGAFDNCADAISVVGTSGAFDATIVDNTITATELSQCGGIQAYVGGGPSATTLIERNIVRGSNFDYGISLRSAGANVGQSAGQITGRIFNNLVSGQNGNVGAPGGIVVSASGNNALINAAIVNNTVANGRTGVRISARTDLGASIVGSFNNNTVAFHSQGGIDIDSDLSGFTNSNNLVFANTSGNFFTAGPGTRTGDPRFVNAASGNYALAADSDAIDRGADSALPSSSTIDLAGNARRSGTAIDIGAFESTFARAADVVSTVPTLGTTALWALFIALGFLGMRSRRWQYGKRA